ncbi:MAG: DUF996 domain-containing protein [Candidatus Bathyarchaeota archaeon]|nr:DUF996 domain-containing protein [Candidatus Bathyarchaeota archaeon]
MATSFEYCKTLAMEGSILLILGVVPYVGWVLGIVGIFLLVRAMREFASYYQDNSIYHNAVGGIKYYIVALIALGVSGAGFIVGLVVTDIVSPLSVGNVVGVTVGAVFLVVAFIFYILAAARLRKTFNALAQKTGEHSFATAGMLLWIGSILTIIVIGLLLIFIAWVFAIVGFFSMKSPMQKQYNSQTYEYTPSQPQPTTTSTETYCSNCGAPLKPQDTYCSSCGKKVE